VHGVVGIGLVCGGAFLGLATNLILWRRLEPALSVVLAAVSGAVVAAGALLVQDHAGVGDWAIAVTVLAVLTPIHGRVVFGRPGART
jgi:hypothetical protein